MARAVPTTRPSSSAIRTSGIRGSLRIASWPCSLMLKACVRSAMICSTSSSVAGRIVTIARREYQGRSSGCSPFRYAREGYGLVVTAAHVDRLRHVHTERVTARDGDDAEDDPAVGTH